MFSVGFGEILVILLAVTLLFGPEQMALVARKIRRFLISYRHLRDEASRAVKDLEREILDDKDDDKGHDS